MIAGEDQGYRLPRRRLYDQVKRALRLFARVRKDDGGATLIEYSVLLSFLSVATVFLVISVGDWVSDQWVDLDSTLESTCGVLPDSSEGGGCAEGRS